MYFARRDANGLSAACSAERAAILSLAELICLLNICMSPFLIVSLRFYPIQYCHYRCVKQASINL